MRRPGLAAPIAILSLLAAPLAVTREPQAQAAAGAVTIGAPASPLADSVAAPPPDLRGAPVPASPAGAPPAVAPPSPASTTAGSGTARGNTSGSVAAAASPRQPTRIEPARTPKPPKPAPVVTTTPKATTPASSERVIKTAFVTGYSWFDNTPVGSAAISHPVLHAAAGGTGTYADPITVAVGHSLATGKDVLDYPAGTRFYVPHLHRYFIVEDTCGDGPTPQNMPCHKVTGSPSGTTTWIDVYIGGGSTSTAAAAESCATKITGLRTMIVHPRSTYVVATGAILKGVTCTATYSTTASTA